MKYYIILFPDFSMTTATVRQSPENFQNGSRFFVVNENFPISSIAYLYRQLWADDAVVAMPGISEVIYG